MLLQRIPLTAYSSKSNSMPKLTPEQLTAVHVEAKKMYAKAKKSKKTKCPIPRYCDYVGKACDKLGYSKKK